MTVMMVVGQAVKWRYLVEEIHRYIVYSLSLVFPASYFVNYDTSTKSKIMFLIFFAGDTKRLHD